MNMSFTECLTEMFPPKQLEEKDVNPDLSETPCNMAHKTYFFIFACGHHLKHGGEKPNEKASS